MNRAASGYPMASLYVGNLHPEVTEAMLYEHFSPAGPVLSIRVCRDSFTHWSLGYAYVTFMHPADAKRALDTMNFDPIQGKPIRIMWSQQDPSLTKSRVGNVFIKNLDKSVDNKALFNMFSIFGNILSCNVARDKNGSEGGAFVHFQRQDAADWAAEKMSGMLLNGRKISVSSFKSRKEQVAKLEARAKEFASVYNKNSGDDTGSERAKELFGKYHKPLGVEVMAHPIGKSKGFGFVNSEKCKDADKAVVEKNGEKVSGEMVSVGHLHGDADEAVEEMPGKVINGEMAFVGRVLEKREGQAELKQKLGQLAQESPRASQGANLYISNLEGTVDDVKLKTMFSPFGSITSAKVVRENGKSRGFVCFSCPEEATKAISEMNGQIVGSQLLCVTLAKTKEERQTQLTNQEVREEAETKALPTQTVGQPSQPAAGGSFTPAVPQVQSRPSYYVPNQMTQMGPNLHWQQWVRPQGFQGMPIAMYQPGLRPLLYHLPLAGNAQALCGLPAAPLNVSVTNTAPNLAPRPPVVASAPGAVPPYCYALSVRHPHPMVQCMQVSQPAVHTQRLEPLTPSPPAAASPQEEQKQILAGLLFPLIQKLHLSLAKEITGMLLKMDNSKLLRLLGSPELLRSKVEEVVASIPTKKEVARKVGVTKAPS